MFNKTLVSIRNELFQPFGVFSPGLLKVGSGNQLKGESFVFPVPSISDTMT